MKCLHCRALCRETDGRCHGCGEALPVGIAGNLPKLFRMAGLAAGSVALPFLFFNSKYMPDNARFAAAAALAGVGGGVRASGG